MIVHIYVLCWIYHVITYEKLLLLKNTIQLTHNNLIRAL